MHKNVEVSLEYHATQTEFGSVLLASPPSDLSGLRISVYPDEWLPDGRQEFESTGLHQIHISGTLPALRDLGMFLLAVSEQEEPPRDFVAHLEPIEGGPDSPNVHLVVHHKYTEHPQVMRRIGNVLEADELEDAE